MRSPDCARINGMITTHTVVAMLRMQNLVISVCDYRVAEDGSEVLYGGRKPVRAVINTEDGRYISCTQWSNSAETSLGSAIKKAKNLLLNPDEIRASEFGPYSTFESKNS